MYVKKILSVILPLGFCILLFTHPVLAAEGCTAGLTLWYQAVLPSLLPFMIVSGLLIHTGLFHFLNSFYAPLFQRLFRISEEGCYAVLMGFLCGFPMGAKTTADLVRQGHLTREEGTYLLGFCNNVSPAFFMNYICMHALGYHQIPWKIVLLFYALPVCYGILTRPFYHFPYDRNICTKKQAPMQRLTFPMLDACIMDSLQPLPGLADILFCFLSAVGCCSLFLPHLQCGCRWSPFWKSAVAYRQSAVSFPEHRPSVWRSLFLRFFWRIMYFCADKKCPLSCRNQDTVIYCWASVSGSSVVSSVSSFTEAVSGASSWRLLMIVS